MSTDVSRGNISTTGLLGWRTRKTRSFKEFYDELIPVEFKSKPKLSREPFWRLAVPAFLAHLQSQSSSASQQHLEEIYAAA